MTSTAEPGASHVQLRVIAREWVRIGCIGFGGPPAHITLLRKLCVDRHGWLSADEFEDGIAATNLLPGPASTQLAIFCAWRLAGPAGAIVGGACFIVPPRRGHGPCGRGPGGYRRLARGRLGRVQSRRAVVRRWLRGHPADAPTTG